MGLPKLFTMGLMFAGGLAVAAGCSSDSSDGDDTGSTGGGVGSACTSDADCTGYDNPKCITEIKPTANLITDPSASGADVWEELSMPFPGGYCSNDLGDLTAADIADNSCEVDTDCGDGGSCFKPLEGFSEEDLISLQAALPIDVPAFGSLGLCLKDCESDDECRTDEGYLCVVPLRGVLDTLVGVTDTYCMDDKNYCDLVGGCEE